jgi:superfamily II DNA/RNA helicase
MKPSISPGKSWYSYNQLTALMKCSISQIEVRQEGEQRIIPIKSFDTAGLHPVMLKNIKLAGFTVPTPIQQYSIPAVHMGHDLIAIAQTGKSTHGTQLSS